MELSARYRGCLLGVATGDAVGTTLEFKSPGSFIPIDDMVGGGEFRLRPGEWTDDTAMTLCLAESLIEARGFHPRDQMKRYVRWLREGRMSSTGEAFVVGNTIQKALEDFERHDNPFAGPTDERSSGTGSIMRVAPIALYFRKHPAQAIHLAGESSRTTHGSRICVDACRYYTAILVGLLEGRTIDEVLGPSFSPVPGTFKDHPLHPLIAEVAEGSFKRREPPAIRGEGFVVRALEAVLWGLHKAHQSAGTSGDFRASLLRVVNLGDDADTCGAMFGALAGAAWGESQIPERWRLKLAKRPTLERLADELLKASEAPTLP